MNSSTTREFRQDHLRRNTDFNPIEDVKQDFASSPSTVRTRKAFEASMSLRADRNEVHQRRGQKVNRTAITGASGTYVAQPIDYLLAFTSLVFTPSVSLPRPSTTGTGKLYIVKDEAGGAASTTITVASAEGITIDGATTSTLTTNYQAKSFYTDGANWFTY